MSGRNRGPPLPIPPIHEPPYGRNHPQMHHPALREEMREAQFSMGPRHLPPPHPAIMEERLAAQHQDIQGLLADNQRLAATHVALKQELESAQHELQQTDRFARNFLMEKDMQMREMYEKSAKMEHDLHGVEAMRAEVMQLHADITELTATRQKLTGQVQGLTQDLARFNSDLQKVPVLKSEIDGLLQELQRARAAIEQEKKGYAVNYEHGQVMEKNLHSMARELDKLRADMANAEKRARSAAAVANQNPGYNNPNPNPNPNPNYVNAEGNYAGNPYPASYGITSMNQMNQMNPVQQSGGEGYPQYGHGPASWGSYDMQRGQGHR